jgi:hypothetical protein
MTAFHHGSGVAGPGPVISLGVPTERLRDLPVLMRFTTGRTGWCRRYIGHAPTIWALTRLGSRCSPAALTPLAGLVVAGRLLGDDVETVDLARPDLHQGPGWPLAAKLLWA